MIDTHCHLNSLVTENGELDYNKVDDILHQMEQNKVGYAITMGTTIKDSKLAIELANKYKNIYCAIGVHPEELDCFDEVKLEKLIVDNLRCLKNNCIQAKSQDCTNKIKKEDENISTCFEDSLTQSANKNVYFEDMLKNKGNEYQLQSNANKLVAIGEIGLDYYWRKDNKDMQIRIFKKQVELAIKYDLPIVVHCREAYGDCLEILKQYYSNTNKLNGVIHCYAGSIEWACEIIKLGFIISFTGVVTYNNAKNVQEVAKWIDLDKIMVETDSPFLTPVPYRGKENNPSYVVYVAKKIAELKDISYEYVNNITDNNAKKLFKIDV